MADVVLEFGFAEGWSLDKTTVDENGEQWSFCKFHMRKTAMFKVSRGKPTLVIVSPMCINFSMLINFNWNTFGEEEEKMGMADARVHLEFGLKIRRVQHAQGRRFCHERRRFPTSA